MAVSIEDIKKLRHMTGAGMMDCKNALAETDGDINAAIEIIRKKGQAVAAKREDRNAAEGCVFSGVNGNFAAIATLKCETDFVAKNESFRALAKKVLEVALANKAKSLDDLKALAIDGRTVAELITDEIGKTGEKMDKDRFRRDLGNVEEAYNEVFRRLGLLTTTSTISSPLSSVSTSRALILRWAAKSACRSRQ
jgi:elongation factor Ts